jgi:hypothetical protein
MTVDVFGAAAQISLPLLVAAFALPAFGMDVDFTTTGTFSCGSAVGCSTSNNGSTVTITNDGNTLKMTAIGITNLDIPVGDSNLDVNGNPFDDVNAITFNTTSTNHPSPAGGVNTAGLTFTLNIDQTSPPAVPNIGSVGASFTGSIDAKGSNTTVNFTPNQTSVILGGNVEYMLDFLSETPDVWTIPNPGINKTGVTTETATVDPKPGSNGNGLSTPEPTFTALTGLGFSSFALVAYRRRRTA